MGDDEGAGATQPRFSAFISYSHADAASVRKLHSKLEAYRLPKDLGTIDALNSRKRGLGKVFRDREDLSAAQNLSDAVRDALGRSEVLVVVCSPNAKASHWVGQEIAYFREHQPGKPILAAIVSGEPEDAFPEALTRGGTEPLAADLRKEGDGWKLGFLKVVAGIAGVPLDALVQRDSQRQMRRVMAVTGVVALVAIAMAVMTTIALQARNEAQVQRDEAEGLVEYMITDLRGELEGVGRLDIMEGVSREALRFYERQSDLSEWTAESLFRRARVVETLGRIEDRRGNVLDALAHYRELFRTTRELLDRRPNNPERILAHAWSENRIATFEQPQVDSLKSQARFDRVLQMLEPIRGWGKANPLWWRTHSLTSGNKCAVAVLNSNDSAAVLKNCRDAIAGAQSLKLLGDTEDAEYDHVFHLYWLAKMHELRGNQVEADMASEKALSASQVLVQNDPRNAKFLAQRMEILGGFNSNDLSKGRAHLHEAIALADRLIELEPEDADIRRRRTEYQSRLGDLL